MTTNHHTPITYGAPAASATVNDPLGDLDSAITDLTSLPFVTIYASGSDDGPAIQAAVADGVTIYLPDPAYDLDTDVLIDVHNCFIVGNGGANNPTAEASTHLNGDGKIIFDMSPGLTAQLEDSPQYVVNGGGLRNLVMDGGAGTSLGGLRIVSARNLVFEDVMVRGYAVCLDFTNHGGVAGGVDAYDSSTGVTFDRCHFIATSGVGIKMTGVAYSCAFIDCSVAVTSTGYGIDLYDVDDIMFARCRVLCQDVGGTQLRLNGDNYGGGKAATDCVFDSCYFNGAIKKIVTTGNGYGIGTRRNLFVGLGTVDGEVTWTSDVGSAPSYIDTNGNHNLRLHGKTTYSVTDDFTAGGTATGLIGDLRWSWVGGTAVVQYTGGGNPGIVRLDTSTTINTQTTLALWPNTTATAGPLTPYEGFDSEFIWKIFNATANTVVRVGFTSDYTASIPTSPTHGIYLEKLTADTVWYAVCRSGGTQTRSTVADPVTANPEWTVATDWIRLRIKRHNSTTIGFSIGDTINDNDDVRITTNIPTAALTPFYQIKTLSAASIKLDIDRFQLHVTGLAR